ncbi:MAG: hypothetical protein WBD87_09710 [Candidatus Acidiferrales bacterium]
MRTFVSTNLGDGFNGRISPRCTLCGEYRDSMFEMPSASSPVLGMPMSLDSQCETQIFYGLPLYLMAALATLHEKKCDKYTVT